jgi:hypothetical protein
VATAAATPVTLNGGSGNDTFNVASGGNLDTIAGAVTVNGGGGSANVLNVKDGSAPAGETYHLNATTLTRPGAANIAYSGLSKVVITAGNHGNAFFEDAVLTKPTTLILGTGTNTLYGPNAVNSWAIKSLNGGTLGKLTFTGAQNLVGNMKADTFSFAAAAGAVSGTITGGGGGDKLNYQGNDGVAVTVNLQTGAATSTGGIIDIGNFTSLTGSSNAANLLIAANTTNNWTISSADGGKVNAFAYTEVPNLQGGTGLDIFKFTAAGREASIVGSGAPAYQGDWLDYAGLAVPVSVNLATGMASINGGPAVAVSGIQNVRGGNGGNTLVGDAQGNLLIGGTGADTISGGSGASFLIGDKGADHITGGSGGDILIGDFTTYDASSNANDLVLMAILAEWQSNDGYGTRVADITGGGGLNGGSELNKKTVKNDSDADVLQGAPPVQAGFLDWFFVSAGDTSNANSNGEGGEQVTTI